MRVEHYPDLLPLRDAAGRRVGLFADRGSWLALCWGDAAAIEIHDTRTPNHPQPPELPSAFASLDFESKPVRRTVWPDRLELELSDGRTVLVSFSAPQTLLVTGAERVRTELPQRLVEDGILLGEHLDRPHPPGLLERNRAMRQRAFDRAATLLPATSTPRDHLLAARAITTLAWNWRAPIAELTADGCIPSPFAYRGYWGWDSWKHAHALARIAPEFAGDQVRVQLARQRGGMVPDTVMPWSISDNWKNTKPPLAAWALAEIARSLTAESRHAAPLARELYPACAAALRWWDTMRRHPGETLHRPGGVNWETATWDLGWDQSARFEGVGLRTHGEWRLLDAVPPDLAAFVLVECQALARLAALSRKDEQTWLQRASEQRRACADLWDARLGAFTDRRDDGQPGLLSAACALPVWAGAATSEQTERTRDLLADPAHFATPMPFPALARSAPGFDADDYWNGGVWIDHAAWSLAAMGSDPRALPLRERLLDGIARQGTLWECFNPLSGNPCAGGRPAVPQFSWSAAGVLEILTGGLTTTA
jgi:putative isomerase